jgi:hypothetical protein
MFVGNRKIEQRITPTLMFVGQRCGRAEEAVNFYSSVFHDPKVDHILRYGKDDFLFRVAGNEERYRRIELEEWPCVGEPELLAKKLNGKTVHSARKSVVKRCSVLDLGILEDGCIELGSFFGFFLKPQGRRDCLDGMSTPFCSSRLRI